MNKSDLAAKYHYLAYSSLPSTERLYGDDCGVNKNVREINDLNRIGRNMAKHTREVATGAVVPSVEAEFEEGGFLEQIQLVSLALSNPQLQKTRGRGTKIDTEVCLDFHACRLKNYVKTGEKSQMIKIFQILFSIVKLGFLDGVNPVNNASYTDHFSVHQNMVIDQELSKLLNVGVLKEVEHHPKEYISPIFEVPKKER